MQSENAKKILVDLAAQIDHLETDRSIRNHFMIISGRMTEQVNKWWEGLAKELEVDIETLDE